MSNEEINAKLNMIYEELFNINWKLNKLQDEKKKEDIEFTIKRNQRELEEIHFRENDYWNLKETKMKEFNFKYGEMESEK